MNTIEGRLREGSLRPEEALEFARKLDRLAELARRLRDYATASSSAKATAEAYRAVSTLRGRSPEEIEKELAKLKEALKEFKASH